MTEAILKQILEQLIEIKILIRNDIEEKKAVREKFSKQHNAHDNKNREMLVGLTQRLVESLPNSPVTPILQEMAKNFKEGNP